ncbi:Fasciclin-like arabinogalactan protein 11 [Striga hermonthica]|uniref:Fasciclin-like arabinogalactan protein 11 n=1 Tax=Striga hermonthica TaxID=68872 RepID=A0A9N7RJK0_STRHE|nr:Fasciclin-like arabinogalactan protein 11 [Striga hermonthica]
MRKLLTFSLPLLLFLLSTTTTRTAAQSPAAAPSPPPPTNLTAILEKSGQYSMFIRLLQTTKVADQIDTQLNNSKNQGMTLFAPTDSAFSSLKPGILNSFTDQQKVELVQFHIVPRQLSLPEFQTATNPLMTQAGGRQGSFDLNVTTSGSTVNVTTGVTNATVANTVYTDGQLAVYQVDRVLLPLAFFQSPAPAPAPARHKKDARSADAQSDDAPAADSSSGARVAVQVAAFVGIVSVNLVI